MIIITVNYNSRFLCSRDRDRHINNKLTTRYTQTYENNHKYTHVCKHNQTRQTNEYTETILTTNF